MGVNGCPPFRPILSVIYTPAYKLAKFLVAVTVKDTFQFTEEIRQKDSQHYMASLDVDSLFTNILWSNANDSQEFK